MKKYIIDFIKSFYNGKKFDEGISARKLTAFALMICVAYCHWMFVDASVVVSVIAIDLGFVALLLGIITAANLIEIYHGKKYDKTEDKQDDN